MSGSNPLRRSASLALACALLAGGCSFMPAYERPAAPVPAAFPSAGAETGPAASELPWQRFFTDARLQRLITTALGGNRDLRIAVLAIEQARATLDARAADRLPTVGAQLSGTRGPAAGSTREVTSFNAGLAISAWEIDFFGRIASLNEAALAQLLASEEGRHAAQAALVASVASAWLNVVAGDELLALTRQTLATREESLRLVRLRVDAGASSGLDLQQAQSLAESARATLAQLERQRAQDTNALALLLGQPVPPELLGGIDTAGVSLPDLPAGTPSDVLVRRPDVRQAEQQLVAANANIGAARAAFFPRISLTAAFGSVSSELTGLFSGGTWAYTVAPSLLLPIFDAGRNTANLRGATVAREVALAQYERAIQAAFRDVADALAGRQWLAQQLAAQSAVARAEAERLKLVQLRSEAGVASSLDLLDAQRSVFTARQAEVQLRAQRLQNQVQLYRALGGGWAN